MQTFVLKTGVVVTVRKARRTDAPRCSEILLENYVQYAKPHLRPEDWERLFERVYTPENMVNLIPLRHMHVISFLGRAIGVGGFEHITKGKVEILNVSFDSGYQACRLGTLMMLLLMREAFSRSPFGFGVNEVVGHCNHNSAHMVASLGFKEAPYDWHPEMNFDTVTLVYRRHAGTRVEIENRLADLCIVQADKCWFFDLFTGPSLPIPEPTFSPA